MNRQVSSPTGSSGRDEQAAARIAELEAEVVRLREALVEAAERIEGDDHQIHSEWGVGSYEADPYIEELRALARGEVPNAVE